MATFEQTYALNSGARVEIEQQSGNMRIVGWDQAEVRLRATTVDDSNVADRIRVDSGAHRLAIEVLSPGSWFAFGRSATGVDLELMVPTGTRLGLETGSGDIWVENTFGPVSVEAGSGNLTLTGVGAVSGETGSGDVRLNRVDGVVRLETGSGNATLNEVRGAVDLEVGSGDLVLRAIAGSVKAETGSGNLLLAEVEGQIELETGSGDLRVSRVRSPRLHVSTGGGNLTLEQIDAAAVTVESGHGDVRMELAAIHPRGKYAVESSSGNVTVLVPPAADLKVKVECSAGRIRHDGLALRTVRMDRDELEAVLGTGGAELSIESSAGDVTLKPSQCQTPLVQAIREDKALENSEQLQRVLRMVEEGKLRPEEASQLLAALDEEEVAPS